MNITLLIIVISGVVLLHMAVAVLAPYILRWTIDNSEIGNVKLRNEIKELVKNSGVEISDIRLMGMTRFRLIVCGMWFSRSIFISSKALMANSLQEITALVAHELGHYYHKHNTTGLILSMIKNVIGGVLFTSCISYLPGELWLSIVAGISVWVFAVAAFNFFISNPISRKQEYQADEYSAMVYSPNAMISVLNRSTTNKRRLMRMHPQIKSRITRLVIIRNEIKQYKEFEDLKQRGSGKTSKRQR